MLLILSCAQKEGNVVYLDETSGLKKVKEVCEEDFDGSEVCREIYVKPVPAVRESLYEKERKETLLKLLRTPPSPVRTPDAVLKVYLLPWTDDEGNFHAGGYVFVVVEEGEWILSEGPEKSEEARKVLTPLKVEKNEGK